MRERLSSPNVRPGRALLGALVLSLTTTTGLTAVESPSAGAQSFPCTFAADANGDNEVAPSEARTAGCKVPACLDIPSSIDTDRDGFAEKHEQVAGNQPCSGGLVRKDRSPLPPPVWPTGSTIPVPAYEPPPPTTTTIVFYNSNTLPPGTPIEPTGEPRGEVVHSAAYEAAMTAEAAGCGGAVQTEGLGGNPGCAKRLAKVIDELGNDGRYSEVAEKFQARFAPNRLIHNLGDKRCGVGTIIRNGGMNNLHTNWLGGLFGEVVNGGQIIACGKRGGR